MNRTDSATFGAGVVQLFRLAKMDSLTLLAATFSNGPMGFFHFASSFFIRPKSAKIADIKGNLATLFLKEDRKSDELGSWGGQVDTLRINLTKSMSSVERG
jgi:hypothetical protein